MTTALCFNCGETKFGAWCPCGNCGVESSGDRNLDILFSDHQMTVATLNRFGGIIKQLAQQCDDPQVRFWAFISYLSSHPAKLLTATPPSEIADQVAKVLTAAKLPIVEADLKSPDEDTGPPQKTIPIPEPLLRAFLTRNQFDWIQAVQVRRRDGVVFNGVLIDLDGAPQFMLREDIELLPQEITAIRVAPGCLIGWFIRPKWVEAP